MCRTLVLSLAMVLAGSSVTRGQQPSGDTRDALGVSVLVQVRSLVYSRPNGDVTSFLVTEPLPVEISVDNRSGTTLTVGTAERPWTDALRFSVETLESMPQRKVVDVAAHLPAGSRLPTGPLGISAGRAVTSRFLLVQKDGQPLAPGRYRLSVAVNRSLLTAKARVLRNLASPDVVIDIREPGTIDERADQYLQRGYLAASQGRPAEMRRWAENVLEINPNSVAALSDIGTSFVREGNCVQGAPLLTRMINLLETGADLQLRIQESGRRELASAARSRLSAQCGR